MVADDHLNAFSFNAVPALCVRIGREVQRMTQDHAEAFDKVLETGQHAPLLELTMKELHESGEHEFLNWMVLIGAVSPATASVRYFGELPRINMAAVEWNLA